MKMFTLLIFIVSMSVQAEIVKYGERYYLDRTAQGAEWVEIRLPVIKSELVEVKIYSPKLKLITIEDRIRGRVNYGVSINGDLLEQHPFSSYHVKQVSKLGAVEFEEKPGTYYEVNDLGNLQKQGLGNLH